MSTLPGTKAATKILHIRVNDDLWQLIKQEANKKNLTLSAEVKSLLFREYSNPSDPAPAIQRSEAVDVHLHQRALRDGDTG